MNQRDFVGFSFNGVHSSDLGLYHVSDGNWYEETLQPDFEDRTNTVPGRDGEYYYGSDYTTKTIEIQIAFDHVTEKQFRQIGYLFSTKKLCPLVFDERPYKEYMVKISSPISLNYVCFDEEKVVPSEDAQPGVRRERGVDEHGDPYNKPEDVYPYVHTGQKERIYKGEGSIEFVCRSPLARAPFHQLEKYETRDNIEGNVVTTWSNVDEWKDASGILSQEEFDRDLLDRMIPMIKTIETQVEPAPGEESGTTVETEVEYGFKYCVYNPGDINTPFYLYIPFTNQQKITGEDDKVVLKMPSGNMVFDAIIKKGEDTGIVINTNNHLIEGVIFDGGESERQIDSWHTTGNLYNEYLIKGDFPKIIHYGPFQLVENLNGKEQEIKVFCDTSDMDKTKIRLLYDYFYY